MNKITISILILLSLFVACKNATKTKEKKATETVAAVETPDLDWREDYAYTIGKQAYIYGYPALYYAQLRFGMVEKPQGLISFPINQFFHIRQVAVPEHQYGGSPNRDTPYSLAFIDMTDEPVVLTMPDNPEGRYMHVQMADFYSDVHKYIGSTTTGTKAGNYLVVGPNFKGKIPTGFTAVVHSPTNWNFWVGRIATDATEADMKLLHALQDGMKVVPLSYFGKKETPPERRNVLDPSPPTDALGAFKLMNAAMKENPPVARDEAIMRQFAQIGLGPYGVANLDSLDEPTKRGLARAIKDGHALLKKVSEEGGSIVGASRTQNNWFYGPSNWGRMAEDNDFLGRAGTQAFSGIVEHYIEESVKLRAFKDIKGEKLNGNRQYVLRFTKEEIPIAKEFWSITVYNAKYNLVANEAKIYSVGNYSPGLKYGTDGSLTIYLQAVRPEGEKAANWLPVAKGEDFNLFLRTYVPGPKFLDQTYVAPGVERVE